MRQLSRDAHPADGELSPQMSMNQIWKFEIGGDAGDEACALERTSRVDLFQAYGCNGGSGHMNQCGPLPNGPHGRPVYLGRLFNTILERSRGRRSRGVNHDADHALRPDKTGR